MGSQTSLLAWPQEDAFHSLQSSFKTGNPLLFPATSESSVGSTKRPEQAQSIYFRYERNHIFNSGTAPASGFQTLAPTLKNSETSTSTPVNTPKTAKLLISKRLCLLCPMKQIIGYTVAILPLIEHKWLKELRDKHNIERHNAVRFRVME